MDEAAKLLLSTEHIELLSQFSEHYVVPENQARCSRQAFIFYCARGRVGAEEEAQTMKNALNNVGFRTQAEEWSNFYRLRLRMREKVCLKTVSCSRNYIELFDAKFEIAQKTALYLPIPKYGSSHTKNRCLAVVYL